MPSPSAVLSPLLAFPISLPGTAHALEGGRGEWHMHHHCI